MYSDLMSDVIRQSFMDNEISPRVKVWGVVCFNVSIITQCCCWCCYCCGILLSYTLFLIKDNYSSHFFFLKKQFIICISNSHGLLIVAHKLAEPIILVWYIFEYYDCDILRKYEDNHLKYWYQQIITWNWCQLFVAYNKLIIWSFFLFHHSIIIVIFNWVLGYERDGQ
jgi:hypothetical protein